MLEFLTVSNLFLSLYDILRGFSSRQKSYIYLFTFLFLTLHDGLRWNMGADWTTYYSYFNSVVHKIIDNVNSASFSEAGWHYFVSIFGFLSFGNYTIYLLLVATLMYGAILFSLSRLTNYSILSLVPVSGYFAWFSGSQRQCVAVALFLLLVYIYSLRLDFVYILPLFYIGFNIHASFLFPFLILSGCFLLNSHLSLYYFFLFRLRFKKKLLFISFFFILLLFFVLSLNVSLLSTIFSVLPIRSLDYLEFSSQMDLNQISIFGIFRKSFVLLYIGVLSFSIRSKSLKPGLFTFCLLAPFISFSLYLSVYSAPFLNLHSRMDLYFAFAAYTILVGILSATLPKKLQLYLFVLVALDSFIIYSRLSCLNLFHPYYFFFSHDIPQFTGCRSF